VALDLTERVCDVLSQWAAQAVGRIDGVRLIEPGSLHVTLCFLGIRPAAQTREIASACETVAGARVGELALAEPAWLPGRRPRVLGVGVVDDGGRLADVREQLAVHLGRWYDREARPFFPHVTVARVRPRARIKPVALTPPPPLRFPAEKVTLYRSDLGSGPARYVPLHHIRLATRT